MRRLILLRHAKSDYPAGVVDHLRPLSERGRRNAATIAERLRAYIAPADTSVAVVSTAVRAQQTWSIVSQSMDIEHWNDSSLYLAEPMTLLEVASTIDVGVGIVVGHNPGLEELARAVESPEDLSDVPSGVMLKHKFPTSAFAVLDCECQSWRVADISCTGFAICR